MMRETSTGVHSLDIVAVFNQAADSGGGFHQSLNSLATLAEACQGQHRLRVLALEGAPHRSRALEELLPALRDIEWVRPTPTGVGRAIVATLGAMLSPHPRRAVCGIRRRIKGSLIDQMQADLVFFLSPSGLATALRRTPYAVTVWDLAHLDYPEFPEVRDAGEFEYRQGFFATALPKAVLVITDSHELSERVHARYGVDRDRLLVQRFSPSPFLRGDGPSVTEVLETYGLEPGYWFYPAQFWAHKNHRRVLEALFELRRRGNHQRVVFAGGDRGVRSMIEHRVRQLGLSEDVRFLGFVPADHLRSLYLGAVGLVFPSYFGPTNLPPLEAISLGLPAVCSDFHERTLGEKARYFNPDDEIELADAMEEALRDPADRVVQEWLDVAAESGPLQGVSGEDLGALRTRLGVLARRTGTLP
jgi:glycosyltransferase involved in cell wall biosynthesis